MIGTKQRRAKGEGSFVQRADGSWQYSVDLGKNDEGKRRRRYIYAKTKSELQRKVFDLRAKSGGTIKPRAIGTVGEWVEQWLAEDVRPNLSANTTALYEGMWRHAAPIVGGVPLERFDVDDVERLYRSLRAAGKSPSVMQRVGITLQRALSVATRRRKYHRPNPFALVDRPKHKAAEARVLNVDEAKRFIAAAREDRLEALWILLLTAGLRMGEALGLEWRDVDLGGGSLVVRQALVEVNGLAEISTTKTSGSRRRLEIGALAVDALRRRRVAAEEEDHSSPYVFPTTRGTLMRRSNVRRSHFAPVCDRAGIEGLTPHGLRHSMTSLMMAEGVAPKILSERLGHTTVRMTQDRYGHVLPGVQRAATNALDVILSEQS